MQIRPAIPADLDCLLDVDATIDSPLYLHLERTNEALSFAFSLSERALREKRLDNNALSEDALFDLSQLIGGIDDGIVLVAEHDGQLIGLAMARSEPITQTMRLLDIRIDFDFRRQGIGSAMLFQIIAAARAANCRAVTAHTTTHNHPACAFLNKSVFELAGFDTHLHSNHDLVKEAVTLFWYCVLQ